MLTPLLHNSVKTYLLLFISLFIKQKVNNKWNLINNIGNQPLNGEYIAGLVQADGSFSCRLTRKVRDNKTYLNLAVTFTLVQKIEYKDLILEIQKTLGGIGIWYTSHKDKTIIYQINKISDLHNVIIPYFMKYQLKSGKLKSFLIFKYIVNIMFNRLHVNNHNVLLSLIVLASNLNPLGKLGNNIRYLTKQEQDLVLNNKQPDNVDITLLTNEINNFKSKPITIDFLNGLIDGDGNITVYFEHNKLNYIRTRINFTIVQDSHNLSLLEDIKNFFNIGNINVLNKNCCIYKTSSVNDLAYFVLPKFFSDISRLNKDNAIDINNSLPIIKRNKIIYTVLIINILINNKKLTKDQILKIINYSYYVSEQWYNKSLTQYINELKEKYIIEDIV